MNNEQEMTLKIKRETWTKDLHRYQLHNYLSDRRKAILLEHNETHYNFGQPSDNVISLFEDTQRLSTIQLRIDSEEKIEEVVGICKALTISPSISRLAASHHLTSKLIDLFSLVLEKSLVNPRPFENLLCMLVRAFANSFDDNQPDTEVNSKTLLKEIVSFLDNVDALDGVYTTLVYLANFIIHSIKFCHDNELNFFLQKQAEINKAMERHFSGFCGSLECEIKTHYLNALTFYYSVLVRNELIILRPQSVK